MFSSILENYFKEELGTWSTVELMTFSTIAPYAVNQQQVPSIFKVWPVILQQYKAASSPFYLFIYE